ncbi:putative NBD/HSP70 family sugar kinase [Edaphobacter lichenicola]|uniref:NBD/HSP70 family sugar kinase n=2 Tax=Tunturiibacter TaxID=3154218 RepID=A0A7W8N357_9BACT|nr:putative NBD/HSP70 family sugar kinase [Edaphobacter lichenicola]
MADFGAALAEIVNKYCAEFIPDVIVIGGSIAKSADVFIPSMEAGLDPRGPEVIVSRRIDEAALIGAAVFWTGMFAKKRSPNDLRANISQQESSL